MRVHDELHDLAVRSRLHRLAPARRGRDRLLDEPHLAFGCHLDRPKVACIDAVRGEFSGHDRDRERLTAGRRRSRAEAGSRAAVPSSTSVASGRRRRRAARAGTVGSPVAPPHRRPRSHGVLPSSPMAPGWEAPSTAAPLPGRIRGEVLPDDLQRQVVVLLGAKDVSKRSDVPPRVSAVPPTVLARGDQALQPPGTGSSRSRCPGTPPERLQDLADALQRGRHHPTLRTRIEDEPELADLHLVAGTKHDGSRP